MKPLTAEEIAELRSAHKANEMSAREYRDALPRLLDEVEELRKHLDAVSGPRWREEREAHERSRALLKRIEWMGSAYPDASDMPCCPACDCEHSHDPDCDLAALLGGTK